MVYLLVIYENSFHIRSRQPLGFLYIGFVPLSYCTIYTRNNRKSTRIMQAPFNGRNYTDQDVLHDE